MRDLGQGTCQERPGHKRGLLGVGTSALGQGLPTTVEYGPLPRPKSRLEAVDSLVRKRQDRVSVH